MATYLGVLVNFNGGKVKGRDFRDILILALTLLFLEFERDATDGATLNALHQVGREPGNLVSQALGGNNGDFISELLVRVEVKGQTGVVLLNEDSRGLFHSLGANSSLRPCVRIHN